MFPRSCVKSEEESPCSTSLFQAMPSSMLLHFRTYTMGANVSLWTTGASCGRPVMMVGSTKLPSLSITFPPNSILPPALTASSRAAL